jgi:hypothetical protein
MRNGFQADSQHEGAAAEPSRGKPRLAAGVPRAYDYHIIFIVLLYNFIFHRN